MRRLGNLCSFLLVAAVLAPLLAGCTVVNTYPADDPYPPLPPEDPTGGMFVELSYYGDWLLVEPFGWVWSPYSGPEWQPFYHGHWIWTTWEWTWISYEPFGWAAYHYGNWHYDPVWGWLWLPGYEWHPSRVQWIVYDDYIGWAPLPPRGYAVGDPWSVHVEALWNVVPAKHFASDDVGRFRVKSRSATGTVDRRAPQRRVVETHAGIRIPVSEVQVEKTRVGDREKRKLTLPPSEIKRVDHYKTREKRRVERDTRRQQDKVPPAASGNRGNEEPPTAKKKRKKEPAVDKKEQEDKKESEKPTKKRKPKKKKS